MLCFDVSVNGKRVCRAGMKGRGVVAQTLTWVQREGRAEELHLRVGGLDHNSEPGEHVYWPTPEVRAGDTVALHIFEAPEADASMPQYPAEPNERKVSQATVMTWEMKAALRRAADLKRKIAALKAAKARPARQAGKPLHKRSNRGGGG